MCEQRQHHHFRAVHETQNLDSVCTRDWKCGRLWMIWGMSGVIQVKIRELRKSRAILSCNIQSPNKTVCLLWHCCNQNPIDLKKEYVYISGIMECEAHGKMMRVDITVPETVFHFRLCLHLTYGTHRGILQQRPHFFLVTQFSQTGTYRRYTRLSVVTVF